ncbi:MAG: DUF86 domain-containing protein [Spirochaetales bacterium]|nr:DUF86 domain-containing protein [Spirochaetales bacterium]
MDPDIIRNKLESLIRCVHRIESKRPDSLKSLQADIDRQDIIVLNLERAVQTCVDIGAHVLADYDVSAPVSMAEVFRTLAEKEIVADELAERLARAVGFRNIAVHQYQSINWEIVYAIITVHLDDFRLFSGDIDRLLTRN